MSKSPKFGKLSKPQAIQPPSAEHLNPNKKSFENVTGVDDRFHRLGAMAKSSPRQMVAKRTFGQKLVLNVAIIGAIFVTLNTTMMMYSKPPYTSMRITKEDKALAHKVNPICLPLQERYNACLSEDNGPTAKHPDQCLHHLTKYARCKAENVSPTDLTLIDVVHKDIDYSIRK